MKSYTRKELKQIIIMLKRVGGEVFVWCNKCERVSLHTFRDSKGKINNLLECSNCNN